MCSIMTLGGSGFGQRSSSLLFNQSAMVVVGLVTLLVWVC